MCQKNIHVYIMHLEKTHSQIYVNLKQYIFMYIPVSTLSPY